MNEGTRHALAWILGLALLGALAEPALAEQAAQAGSATAANQESAPSASDQAAGETPTPDEPLVATVVAARFTSGIENREPIDAITFLGNAANKIYFFTDLRQMKGETITHRWEYQGQVMAEVPFEVKGQRWRAWSSKNLRPDQLGEWTVTVVREDGEVVASESFTYQAKP